MSSSKSEIKTRKSFTLETKIKIIGDLRSGKTQTEVANENNLSRASVACIWTNRTKIEHQFSKSNPKTKKSRKAKHEDLESILYSWFWQQRHLGIPIDGPTLRGKALSLAVALGITEFNASDGWLQRFKARFDLRGGNISGGAGFPLTQCAASWLETKWPVIRAEFLDEDIYNADETALFYKMLPIKSCRTKQDKTNENEKSDSVTVLVCVNMSGCDKKKLLVIGKSTRPRKFPKNHTSLPVTYRSNLNARMTGDLWEQWIRDWDSQLIKANRKILLIIHNCSVHPSCAHLKNITVEYLPPNVTSVKPMDQGIIQSLKTHYRHFLVRKLISNLERKQELLDVSILDAISLVSMAWNAVERDVVQNCFLNAKLCSRSEELMEITDTYETQNEFPTCEVLYDMPLHTETENEEENAQNKKFEDNGLEVVVDIGRQHSALDIHFHLDAIRRWIGENELPESLHMHVSALEVCALEQNATKPMQSNIADCLKKK